jgi:phosphate-selective porin OprO/OprP
MNKSNGRRGPSKGLTAALALMLCVSGLEAGQRPTVPAEHALTVDDQTPEGKTKAAEKEPRRKPPRVSFRWDDHPSLRFGRNTNIDFRARVEGQVLDSEPGVGNSDGFDIVRRRIGVEGRIAGDVDFQVEREFATDDPWRDVFVNYRRFDVVRVQAGKFKMPFGLEENTSSANLDFAYRSLAANQLSPGRDRGVMVHGRVLDALVRYEAGWFAGEGRNARVNNPERVSGGESRAGRLSVQPFRLADTLLRDLEVGLAFTDTQVPEGIAGFRGRTTLDGPLFPAYLWVRGSRHRTGFEARWRPGPFSVKAEYIRVSTERQGQSVEDTDLPALTATGWYVSGTWFITGERKADGGARPRRTLIRGGLGAIELAGRIERLEFASEASDAGPPSVSPRSPVVLPNSDRAVTLGVNWFPVRGIKIQTNVIHETIQDPERGPFPERASFWSSILRIQFSI